MLKQFLKKIGDPLFGGVRSRSGSTSGKNCREFHKLKEWQADQYCRAIDENKWYMAERFDRHVAWEEAEADFLHKGYYGCAAEWRKQFCAHQCPHFTRCDLGQLFCQTD